MSEFFGPVIPRVTRIIKVIARHYGITNAELRGTDKHRRVVEPRQIAFYLIREITDLSFPKIGEIMNRDHTTILHACQKVRLKASDPDFKAMLSAMTVQITESTEPVPCDECALNEKRIAELEHTIKTLQAGLNGRPVEHVERVYHQPRRHMA